MAEKAKERDDLVIKVSEAVAEVMQTLGRAVYEAKNTAEQLNRNSVEILANVNDLKAGYSIYVDMPVEILNRA